MKYWFYSGVTNKMGTISGFEKGTGQFFPKKKTEIDCEKDYMQKTIITHYKEITKAEYEFQTGGEE